MAPAADLNFLQFGSEVSANREALSARILAIKQYSLACFYDCSALWGRDGFAHVAPEGPDCGPDATVCLSAMTQDFISEFEASLIGKTLVVGRREHGCDFRLSDCTGLSVSAPWRIVSQDRIALASADDGKLIDWKTPYDVEAKSRKILGEIFITAATLDGHTADLSLQFGPAARLDVFNNSLAYEGWQATYFVAGELWYLVAAGGGNAGFSRVNTDRSS